MTKDDVIAFKDDDFLILHANDRFNGIVVQLYALIETRRQDADGKIVSLGKQPKLLEQKHVSFFKDDGRPAPIRSGVPKADTQRAFKDPKAFRDAVVGAEAEMKAQMESVYRKMDVMARGVLNDLRSSHKDLNGNDDGARSV